MINHEQINAEWAKDSKEYDNAIDIGIYAKSIYKLHQKYYSWWLELSFLKTKFESKLKILENEKYDYYNGDLDLEIIKKRNWPLQPKKILKSDISRYVQSDVEIVTMIETLGNLNATITFVDGIIRQINGMSFNIKNTIDFEKFKSGI